MTTDCAVICPYCGAEAVAHDHTEGHATPAVGDVSICPGCLCVSVYADGPVGLFRRRASAAESEKIMADPRIGEALAALAHHHNSYRAVAALRRTADISRRAS